MSNLYKITSGNIDKALIQADSRLVPGKYTSDTVDMYGHRIVRDAMIAALPDYMTWATIREMHLNPIGTAQSIGLPEWNDIVASIAKSSSGDEAIRLINSGVYKAFSVGIVVTDGHFIRAATLPDEAFVGLPQQIIDSILDWGEIYEITGLVLAEVSICDRPANPLARMTQVNNSLGVAVDGVLPDFFTKNGANVRAFKGEASKDTLLITKAIYEAIKDSNIEHSENTSSQKEEKQMPDVNDSIGETNATEVAEVDSAEIETTNVEAQETKSTEVVDNDNMAIVEAITALTAEIAELSKNITKTISDSIAGIGETVEFAIKAAISENNSKLENKDDDTVFDNTEKSFLMSEEQIESIAEKIAKFISVSTERKGIVNQDNTETKQIDIKSLGFDELTKAIASSAIARKIK